MTECDTIPFSTAAEQIRAAAGQLEHVEVPTGDLTMRNGRLEASGRSWRRSPEADRALWRCVGIPNTWATIQLQAGDAELPAEVWNIVTGRLSDRGQLPPVSVLYIVDDEIVHIADPRIRTLTSSEVLDVVQGFLAGRLSMDNLVVHRPTITPTHFELNLIVAGRQIQPRAGDIVDAGISVLHSATGQFPTQVTPYACRCVCDNGMIVVVHPERKGPRVRRQAGANSDGDKMKRGLERALLDAWEHIEPALAQLVSLTQHPLAADGIRPYLEQIRSRYALTTHEISAIENAIRNDGLAPTQTLYDVVTGLTRAGTHMPSLGLLRRRELLRAGGDVAVRHGIPCRLCGAIRSG